jgi:hypothetical protein
MVEENGELMRITVAVAVMISCVYAPVLLAQHLTARLNNQDVIDMVSLGLSDDLIIDKIHATSVTDFDTSVSGLRALKAAKVPDTVIRAMINAHKDSLPTGTGSEDSDKRLPDEVGLFLVSKNKLIEMEPEIVNWQTGGWTKSHVSLGIVKEDVNGKVMKRTSSIQVSDNPLEFLVKTPEGTSVTEYQLLRLHEKSDRREFRAATGGVIHTSGGAEPNFVAFSPQKVASRTWRVTLHDLPTGEYGFLPPGVESRSIASSGKMYTFSVIEGSSIRSTNGSADSASLGNSVKVADVAPTFANASIGVFCAENPNVPPRRSHFDIGYRRWPG